MGEFIAGFILGMLGMGILMWKMMPRLMIKVKKSKLPFDEAVSHIIRSAEKHGWSREKGHDIKESLKETGHEDTQKMKIIFICQPHHAYRILRDDENKKVTA